MTDITTLTHQLTSPDPSERLAAALALGGRREAAAAAALVARLAIEDDPYVRENLTWACVQVIDAALPRVLELLHAPDPGARRQAAHVLSKIEDPSLAPHLEGVIADADPEVAVKAFRAAASTGSHEVVPPLVARLAEGDTELRDALTTALARLGHVAVPALIEALGDDDAAVRAHAAETLGHIGSPAADAAAGPLGGLAGGSDEAALAAIMALGALGESAATPLRAVAEGEGPFSGVAVRLLAARG